DVPGVYRTQVADVLVSALGRAIADWTGDDVVTLGLEGHGREDLFDGVDLSRTVGWFTSEFPVTLAIPRSADSGSLLKATKENLRAIPHRGLSYGVLKYLRNEPSLGGPLPDISLNYHGRLGGAADTGLFRAFRPPIGEDAAPDSPRGSLIEVTGA